MTVNFGFRYQYLYYKWDAGATSNAVSDLPNSQRQPILSDKNDQFYGLFLSVVYNFTL